MLTLLFAACTSSGFDVLDETFTAENGLSADVAIVVPEETSSEKPLGALLFFSADFENSYYYDEATARGVARGVRVACRLSGAGTSPVGPSRVSP